MSLLDHHVCDRTSRLVRRRLPRLHFGRSVADAKDRQYIARRTGVWLRLAAQVLDESVDAAAEALKQAVVQTVDPLRTTEGLARMLR